MSFYTDGSNCEHRTRNLIPYHIILYERVPKLFFDNLTKLKHGCVENYKFFRKTHKHF